MGAGTAMRFVLALASVFTLAGCATTGGSSDREVYQFRPYPRPGTATTDLASPDFGPRGSGAPSIWPIKHPDMTVISPFGVRRGTTRGGLGRYHRGIDIKAPRGIPVYATAGGEVTVAGSMRGYGKVVIVAHDNDYMTVYGHLDRITVQKGEWVGRGATIGKLGGTGNASTPHVHYEVRVAGKTVDPAPYLP